MTRILYLSIADARGHLMRAQLLGHGLQQAGAEVDFFTTSVQGQRFLAQFGVLSRLFSPTYYTVFDKYQNMRPLATDLRILSYIFFPLRMMKDIVEIKRWVKTRSIRLIINDSLHPALLFYALLPGEKVPVVHIHGETLLNALLNNFNQRLPHFMAKRFSRLVSAIMQRAGKQFLHNQSLTQIEKCPQGWRLPNPIAISMLDKHTLAQRYPLQDGKKLALIYLNPHFTDPALAEQLEALFTVEEWYFIGISEGFGQRPGWHSFCNCFADLMLVADIFISAPGMAALQLIRQYKVPSLLLVSAQPEQQANANALPSDIPVLNLTANQTEKIDWQKASSFIHSISNYKPTRPGNEAINQQGKALLDAWVQLLLAQKKQ